MGICYYFVDETAKEYFFCGKFTEAEGDELVITELLERLREKHHVIMVSDYEYDKMEEVRRTYRKVEREEMK